MNYEARTAVAAARVPEAQILRGMLYREWIANGPMLSRAILLWVALVWIIPVVGTPGALTIVMAAIALVLGGMVTGADMVEGTEDFTLSLPPTRSRRFLFRAAFVFVPVALMTLFGLLAIRFSLPQAFWGMIVESGFTQPFPESTPAQYLVAVAVPFYAAASILTIGGLGTAAPLSSTVRGLGGLISIIALLVPLIIARDLGWDRNSALRLLSLVALTLGFILTIGGWLLYRIREATTGSGFPLRLIGRIGLVLVIMSALLFVLLSQGMRVLK